MKRFFLLALLLLPLSCHKQAVVEPSGKEIDVDQTQYYANMFAFNNMSAYYLWKAEVADGLKNWTYGDKPIEKVASLRYRDANGKLVDRWTELMEDCSPFTSSVTGNGKTFGMEFILLRYGENQVVMEVTFTYADSPARKAGIQRGDVITTVDGQTLTMDNYADLLSNKIYDAPGTITLGMLDGGSVQMTAVQMYSNPVHTVKVLDIGGKKTGYLHFTNFTLDACIDLVDAFNTFKDAGIEDLVLDLRYNTGGYTTTASVLASMIAPPSVVQEGAVFNKSIYNENLTGQLDEDECFADSFTINTSKGKKTLNTLAANPGIRHLWVIVTGHSASASESLICGLIPYMDVTLVGSNTYGKFCGGYLFTAEEFFDYLAKNEDADVDCAAGKKATAGWGIYVIASRYADCNGVTLSMPSGIPADYEASDDPRDGFALGDPSEDMLSAVLALSGQLPFARPAVKSAAERDELPFSKPGDCALVL